MSGQLESKCERDSGRVEEENCEPDTTSVTNPLLPQARNEPTSTSNHRIKSGHRSRRTLARSSHSSRSNVKEQFEKMFVKFMDSLPLCISRHFFPSSTEREEHVVSLLKDKCNCSFDAQCAEHIELLQRLWLAHGHVVFDNAPFKLSDNKWKEMGFQDCDPARDFRGAGTFALVQLIYLAEEHPAWWNEICTPDFLAAACGINVTMRLLTLLSVNTKRNLLEVQHTPCFSDAMAREKLLRYISNAQDDVVLQRLHEVYCIYMRLLHRHWNESDRNLMNTNALLNSLYKEMNYKIYESNTLDELCMITQL